MRYWIAVGGLALAVVAASTWYGRTAPEPTPLLVAEPHVVDSITVHVSGEVLDPGLVTLPSSARVADAVAAAGGTTRLADLRKLNLAAGLADGQQVVVPGSAEGSDPAAVDDGRVRVNTASVSELEQLPGVGPVLAARIAAHREENGPFSTVEDLLDVSGIGEAKLASLRDAVVLP